MSRNIPNSHVPFDSQCHWRESARHNDKMATVSNRYLDRHRKRSLHGEKMNLKGLFLAALVVSAGAIDFKNGITRAPKPISEGSISDRPSSSEKGSVNPNDLSHNDQMGNKTNSTHVIKQLSSESSQHPLAAYCSNYHPPQASCPDFPREKPINQCFEDVAVCGCYPPPVPHACMPLSVNNKLCYQAAMKDARDPCVGETYPLLALPKKGSVEVISWSARRYWTRQQESGFPQEVNLDRATWVTSSREMQDKCSAWKREQGTLMTRINQALGMPADSPKDVFVLMRVDSQLLKRPCIGLDESNPSAPRCTLTPQASSSGALWEREAFCSHLKSSYSSEGLGYPFTALGYSFDYSPRAGSDYGLTEFVIPKNSRVTVNGILSADELCNLHPAGVCKKSNVIVIGAGISGLTAAMEIRRLNQQAHLNTETTVITGPLQGGVIRNRCSTKVNGWHGMSISGYELANGLYAQASYAGVKMVHERVTMVDFAATPMLIYTNASSRYFADSVVIATGFHAKPDPLLGTRPPPSCNFNFYSHRDVAVVGGGPIANIQVDWLSQAAQHVFLFNSRSAPAWLPQHGSNVQEHYNATVTNEYCLPSRRTALEIEMDNVCRVQTVDDVFVAIGTSPSSSLFPLATNDDGSIRNNPDTKSTSMEKVFAIGAVRGAKTLAQAEADGIEVAPHVLIEHRKAYCDPWATSDWATND